MSPIISKHLLDSLCNNFKPEKDVIVTTSLKSPCITMPGRSKIIDSSNGSCTNVAYIEVCKIFNNTENYGILLTPGSFQQVSLRSSKLTKIQILSHI